MELIPLNKITNEENRRWTKDDGFQQLMNSIREVGILEPPIARRLPDGTFRLVAGRRRIAAAGKLGLAAVGCIVLEDGFEADDEEIALIENVNRLETHPLDEAAAFIRMYERGNSVEGIAEYYARSPAAIYKRIRLGGLIDSLKGMFRDGAINISAAAVLAELPEEEQEKFYKKHEKAKEVNAWAVKDFVIKSQKLRLYGYMGEECGGCKKRTHNKDSSLFEEEYRFTHDVCLEGGECYGGKWRELIEKALEEKIQSGGPAENKVCFNSPVLDGIPETLYKEAGGVTFSGIRYEVLKENGWRFTGETKTKRKKNTCWEIGADAGGITVKRIGYEKKAAGTGANEYENEYEMRYKAGLTELGGETGRGAGELARGLKAKYPDVYIFERDLHRRVKARLLGEFTASEEGRDYAAAYCRVKFGGNEPEAFKKITGLSLGGLSGSVQKVFKFLIYMEVKEEYPVPDPDETGIEQTRQFFDMLFLTDESYRAVYKEELGNLVFDTAEKEEGDGSGGGETE